MCSKLDSKALLSARLLKEPLPGFIDAHSHPASSGRRHLREVDCDLRSIREIQGAIRQRAEKTPPGQWIVGFKYDDTKTAEGRPLTRDDLVVSMRPLAD